MRAAAERLGVAGDVQLLGHVPWDEITSLYDSASVLLFTSLRETFGAPFLEAMGRGLPAVAVDLHGIADVEAGPAAVKVPLTQRPGDLPGQLAAGLRTVLSDDQWEARSVRGGQVGRASGSGRSGPRPPPGLVRGTGSLLASAVTSPGRMA